MASASDAVPVGTLPPVGEIPTRMFAQLVRQDRFGDPRTAFQVEEVDTTLSSVLVGIAAIATLIGGVVIMSLMLIAVSERRREIGVRRAVGATRGDGLRPFLVEGPLISRLGGGGRNRTRLWGSAPASAAREVSRTTRRSGAARSTSLAR